MNFSTDRDLLALEPGLFHDVPLAGQTRVSVADGVVSGTTLTSATADFEAAQVDASDVVLVGDVACEVIARVNATTLTISLLRGQAGDDPIGPGNGSSLAVVHRTFEPQARAAHDELLRMLGIDADGHSSITEDAIVSLSVMRELEALATIVHLYEMAAGGEDENDRDRFRAKWNDSRLRYRRALRGARVFLDLDGDGVADTVRDLGVITLMRS